jgi:hypothetical protein
MVMHDDGIIDLDQNDLNYGEDDDEDDSEHDTHPNVPQERQRHVETTQVDISLAENVSFLKTSP